MVALVEFSQLGPVFKKASSPFIWELILMYQFILFYRTFCLQVYDYLSKILRPILGSIDILTQFIL